MVVSLTACANCGLRYMLLLRGMSQAVFHTRGIVQKAKLLLGIAFLELC